MPVTKQTYSANAPWTATDLAGIMRSALIDAGLMTEWHDSFAINEKQYRVMRIQHNAAKVYGSSFYCFVFDDTYTNPCVALSTGWNPSGTPPVNVPTGTQYLDYHRLPTDMNGGNNTGSQLAPSAPSRTSNIFLDRYTSAEDAKQSWFILRQPGLVSDPFSFLHKDTTLHSWLDLDKGVVSGFSTVKSRTGNRMGYVAFRMNENIRRCLLVGTALRGNTEGSGQNWHNTQYNTHVYVGVGSSASGPNIGPDIAIGDFGGAVALPVAKNSANPAYVSDYSPICTNLPWSPWTPTRLANDFGVYMHYADNDTAYGDRFVVQAALNEWEVLNWANNTVVVDGASSAFVARVV